MVPAPRTKAETPMSRYLRIKAQKAPWRRAASQTNYSPVQPELVIVRRQSHYRKSRLSRLLFEPAFRIGRFAVLTHFHIEFRIRGYMVRHLSDRGAGRDRLSRRGGDLVEAGQHDVIGALRS